MGDEEADWDVSGDINWDDWGDDEGGSVLGGPCVDLFSPTSYDNAALALEAMKASGFDFLRLARSHQCDQYGCIRLINYVRRKVCLCSLLACLVPHRLTRMSVHRCLLNLNGDTSPSQRTTLQKSSTSPCSKTMDSCNLVSSV